MKVSIKLLKGEVFEVETSETDTVLDLKNIIESTRSDLQASRQKLIHAGKVLKDDVVVKSIITGESDFFVCMITKEAPKKPTPTVTTPAPTVPSATTEAPQPDKPQESISTTANPPTSTPKPADVQPPVNSEALQALLSMGFPETESRAALTAAFGNPDLAYEYLLTGIPTIRETPHIQPSSQSGSGNLEALRSHPQFDMLKQLIQTNPASLPQVLNLIGQQNPTLLQSIHENEQEFLAMMNEPIQTTTPASTTAAAANRPPIASTLPSGGSGGVGGTNPSTAQMLQMLSSMPPAQAAQLAQSMGLNPQQFQNFMQVMSQMPPEQLEQLTAQMRGGAGGGMGGSGVGGGGAGSEDMYGNQMVSISQEELESINRLMALGFSQQQALQAYIACDRNETLAANFLFETGGMDDDYDDQDDQHT